MTAEIDATDLEAVLDADDPVRVVDIRSPDAFARGHLPESENVPFGRLPERAEEFAGAERVVTVCPHGKASLKAARLLEAAAGVETTVESLADGIEGWTGDLEADAMESTTTDTTTAQTADEQPEAPF